MYQVEVDDPYLSDGETQQRITNRLEELSEMGYYGNSSIDLVRARPGRIDRENPATAALIDELPTFSDWLDLVPTAAALDSLYDPSQGELANGKPLSPELADWFRNIADGRGIRSRGEVVASLFYDETIELQRQGKWLSLASGAAQRVISTAAQVDKQVGIPPQITLADADRGALQLARGYAEEAGVLPQLEVKRMNVLQRDGLAMRPNTSEYSAVNSVRALEGAVRRKLPAEQYDVVEAVGITEYVPLEGGKYRYHNVVKERPQSADAAMFLKNAYELVRPGGSLVVANMLDTHPQLGFTLNVIQWPHIQPRSIDTMMELFDEAGIEEDREIHLPDDGAYAVYKLRKAA